MTQVAPIRQLLCFLKPFIIISTVVGAVQEGVGKAVLEEESWHELRVSRVCRLHDEVQTIKSTCLSGTFTQVDKARFANAGLKTFSGLLKGERLDPSSPPATPAKHPPR